MKKNVLYGVVFIVVWMVVYHLLDFLYTALITRSAYQPDLKASLMIQLLSAIVTYLVLIVMQKKNKKN